MKKLLFISFLLCSLTSFSQNRALFGTNTLYDDIYGNPARSHFRDSNTFIAFGFPGFSNFGLSFDLRGAAKTAVGDAIYGDKEVDFTPLRQNFGSSNYFLLSTLYDPLMLRFLVNRKRHAEVSISARLDISSDINVRNELLDLLAGGNKSSQGKYLDGFLNMKSTAYANLMTTLGYRMDVTPKLGLGVNASFIKSLIYREANIFSSHFYTAPTDSGAYMDIGANGTLYQAGIGNDFQKIGTNWQDGVMPIMSNTGMAFSLGAQYLLHPKVTVSGSLRDAGFIHYTQGGKYYHLNKSIHYEGVDPTDTVITPDSLFNTIKKLTVDSNDHFKFYRNPNTSIQLGVEYAPWSFFKLKANFENYIYHNIKQVTLSTDLRAGAAHLIFLGGIANNSFNQLGAEFLVRSKHSDFYIGVEQVGNIFSPAISPGINFNIGTAYRIGKKTKHEKEVIRDNKLRKKNHDLDLDGIKDDEDKCPKIKGPKENFGCPIIDKDKDGLIDSLDKCPDVPGPIANMGCPYEDKDKDGILDKDDECPDLPGDSLHRGCPNYDNDNDGIPDSLDRCPNESGPIGNKGCPYKDTDGDGVIDTLDKCPDQLGLPQYDGCPEPKKVELKKEEQAVIDKVFSGLKFNPSSAVIQPASYGVLNDLVTFLLKNPNYKIIVEGHTDNSGDEQKNLKLSQDRAEAVKKYMSSKSIEADRITALGYGSSKPVEDNATAAGRAKNRRVEFNVVQ